MIDILGLEEMMNKLTSTINNLTSEYGSSPIFWIIVIVGALIIFKIGFDILGGNDK